MDFIDFILNSKIILSSIIIVIVPVISYLTKEIYTIMKIYKEAIDIKHSKKKAQTPTIQIATLEDIIKYDPKTRELIKEVYKQENENEYKGYFINWTNISRKEYRNRFIKLNLFCILIIILLILSVKILVLLV